MQENIPLFQINLDDFMEILEEKISQVMAKTIAEKSSPEKKDFYTRKEVSDLLRVSTTTLHNWAKDNILKPKKIGSRVYYSYDEVQSKLQINS